MATQKVHPGGAGYYTTWAYRYPSLNYHWAKVDEDPHNSDTDYIYDTVSLEGSTVTPFLRLNSIDNDGYTEYLDTSYLEYTQEISRPGGGSWTKSDISSLEMGVQTLDQNDLIKNDSFTTLASDVSAIPDGATISKVEIYFVGKVDTTGTDYTRVTCVYLIVTYSTGIIVTPSPVSAVATRVNPTVVLGSLSITPSPRSAVGATIAPTVILGSLSITPQALSAVTAKVDPTVVLGSLSLTPAPVSAVTSGVDPTVTIVQLHPAPTAVEVDRATNPTNASDDPLFSAIFQAYGGSGSATHIYIQVAEDSGFATINWDSGWVAITSCPHGTRSDEISYNGSGLSSSPPDSQYRYFVRIKFKDATETESFWSDTNTFSGVIRPWAAAGYPLRHKLLWDPLTTPSGVPTGYVQSFEFKTGNRQVIATNGDFNEAIQASGGFQIGYYQGRTHVMYLGRLEYVGGSNQLTIYVQSYDHQSGQWGTPFRIGAAGSYFDTHYFPTLVINEDTGHIHAAYGSHGGLFRYTRTKESNQSGALPGDVQWETWINPQTGFVGYGNITGFDGTYPVGIYVKAKGRVYWLSRDNVETAYHLTWSANDGVTWSTVRNFIASTSGTRVYCYGIRWDEKNQRLHISWTHEFSGNLAKGLWYAYSDLDETDGNSPTNEGFNIWRWADGTVAGYTVGGSGSPIDYTIGKAIRFADDFLASIFTETLALDKNGEPIVFWEQKLLNTAVEYARETHIWAARYSLAIGTPGGTWNPIAISEDVDLMLRVRRSSFGVMTTKDGIIRLYMPVSGKTYNQHKPTADVDSVNITRKSEAYNYLELEDGFSGCDLDGSYCDMGATTGQMSFTSNRELPNAVTFFEVDVIVICKETAGDTTAVPYISNGVSDNNGDNKSPTSSYAWYEHVWTQNPFTSSAWTKSAIEGLEFGIKNTGANSLRVSSIFMRVLYSIQSDDENTNSDIWELTSVNDGLTWTKREWSRNSGIGVPIFNHKHHLSNDTIEIVWTSGFDIFYLTDKPYGLVQMTGQDLRLYYNGSEIDRLVDYTNKDKTLICFKVPSAIGVNGRAGARDVELYYGNKNESGQPKSDPNQVYAFQDNFEIYTEGQNINGLNGWTAVSGTWQIWRSPPLRNPLSDGHANKIGSGMQSVRVNTGGTLERTLGSGLQNVYIEGLMWLEGTGGQLYIEVEDASSNKFGVGLNDAVTPSKGGYRDNGTWINSSNVYADRANLIRVALLVTSAGCSAWVNDQIVADEISGISTVDKLRLVAPGQAFFDLIQQSYGGVAPEIEIQPLEARGYYVDCALLGGGQHTYIIDSKIDGDFIKTVNRLVVEHTTAVDRLTNLPVSYERLLPSPFNLPIEYTGSLIGRVNLPIEYGLHLPLANMFPLENLGDKSMAISLPVSLSGNRAIPAYLSLDFPLGLVLSDRLSAETLQSLTTICILPIDSRFPSTRTVCLSADWTGDSLFAITIPTDSLAGMQTARMIPAGTMSRLISSSIVPAVFEGNVAIPTALSVESLVARLMNGSLPVSFAYGLVSTHNLAVSMFGGISFVGMLPADNLASLLKAEHLAVENLVRRDAVAILPTELLQVLRSVTVQPTAWLGGLLDIFIVPVESKMSLRQLTVLPVEVLVGLTGSGFIPTEFNATLRTSRMLPVDWQGTFVLQFPGLLPVDILSTLMRRDKFPIDNSFGLLIHSITAVEALCDLAAPFILPVSASGTVSGRHLLSTETSQTNQQSSFDPVEHLVEMICDGNLPVASDKSFRSITRLPVSWQGTFLFTVPGALPVDFSGTVTIRGLQPMDNLKSLRQNAPVLSIEFSGSLIIPHSIPVGLLQQLAEAYQIPVAGEHSIVTLRQMFVEFLEQRQNRGSLPIGYEQLNEIIGMLSVEWFGGIRLATVGVCPVEWRLTMDMKGHMAVESLVDRVGNLIMPTEQLIDLSVNSKLSTEFSTILSQIVATLSTDWLSTHSLGGRVPVELLTDLEQQFRLSIEGLAKRTLDIELPASWDGAVLMNFPGVLPLSWESTLLARPLMPADNTRTLSMVGGNLLVEWNVSRELSAKFPVEYNEAIEVGANLIGDWLETVNCQGRLSIESRGTIEDVVATFAIEHNRRIFAVSQVPLAELFGLAVSGKIPVEWIGLTFAFLCVRNIKLTIPTAIEIALQVPDVTDAEVYVPEVTGITLKGGEGCQTT